MVFDYPPEKIPGRRASINGEGGGWCIYNGEETIYRETLLWEKGKWQEHLIKILVKGEWVEVPIEECEKQGIAQFGIINTIPR